LGSLARRFGQRIRKNGVPFWLGALTMKYNKTIKLTDLIDVLKTQKKTLPIVFMSKAHRAKQLWKPTV
jgi:hypothetical protein